VVSAARRDIPNKPPAKHTAQMLVKKFQETDSMLTQCAGCYERKWHVVDISSIKVKVKLSL
jgi:hypothetical protein